MTENTSAAKPASQTPFKQKFSAFARRWFIDAFTGMAQGLFVTLIAGTIFIQFGKLIGEQTGVGAIMILIGKIAGTLMGAGIGVGMAKYLKAPNLVIFGCAVAGLAGAFLPDLAFTALAKGEFSLLGVAGSMQSLKLGAPGNPIGAYIGAVVAVAVAEKIYGKTKLDIIVIPLTILITCFVSMFLAIPAIWLISLVSRFIEISTAAVPFIMGIVISVTMGLILTLPTSSAAIWVALASGVTTDTMLLAGGAAVVGCACHMVGFAVMSFRENRWGGLISQGLGTSMLQIPNLMRNPKILIPPVVASAVCGPLATTVFMLRCNASGGGMGTSGLVGVFGVLDVTAGVIPAWQMWLGIILLMFVLPAIISWAVALLLRKIGWIKENDLKLDL